MILRCKVGRCPRTNAARAFSLWNTHKNKHKHKYINSTGYAEQKYLCSVTVQKKCRFDFLYQNFNQTSKWQSNKCALHQCLLVQISSVQQSDHGLPPGRHPCPYTTSSERWLAPPGGHKHKLQLNYCIKFNSKIYKSCVCMHTCDGCPATTHSSLDFTWQSAMAALLRRRNELNMASSTLQSQSSTLPCAFRPLVKPTYSYTQKDSISY